MIADNPMADLPPTCLQWSRLDIQAQALRQGIKIDDSQAQDLLEGFFDDNNEYIIEVINTAMAEYVRENYNEQ